MGKNREEEEEGNRKLNKGRKDEEGGADAGGREGARREGCGICGCGEKREGRARATHSERCRVSDAVSDSAIQQRGD